MGKKPRETDGSGSGSPTKMEERWKEGEERKKSGVMCVLEVNNQAQYEGKSSAEWIGGGVGVTDGAELCRASEFS